ncbi:hypothetical protein SAMN05216480_10484 [Pustulibacterium marinum]|uniref:S-adenosyl-l-methionine hydroxide adenosyltransferase n=1 Tax=Pustulibacterium marinum TaxID=1224947 RepID=A0A1I7GC31_9FLAO|nr:SAM-dependent chlorinase/fluorinase [Pustulibacterium marinum]SFU45994.1 hypothetical protein SAMN05216480_10484 [Pustulibacterium marinum]
MAIITLTTDFGLKDPYVAAMKGAIYSQYAAATIVDITHLVSPFNIYEAAHILKNAYQHFPNGSIHIIGVDCEETPDNPLVACKFNNHYFIGADNGIFSLLAEHHAFEKMVHINLPEGMSTKHSSSHTFVRVATHLAIGGTLEVIGKPIQQIREVRSLSPIVNAQGNVITGNVIYIDNYGNVVTNIKKNWFEMIRKGREFEVVARNYNFKKIYSKYCESVNFETAKENRNDDGKKLAMFNAAGNLEIAIYRSNLQTVGGASSLLGLHYRDTVFINFF